MARACIRYQTGDVANVWTGFSRDGDRAYSLTCPAAMEIYFNKRKCLLK